MEFLWCARISLQIEWLSIKITYVTFLDDLWLKYIALFLFNYLRFITKVFNSCRWILIILNMFTYDIHGRINLAIFLWFLWCNNFLFRWFTARFLFLDNWQWGFGLVLPWPLTFVRLNFIVILIFLHVILTILFQIQELIFVITFIIIFIHIFKNLFLLISFTLILLVLALITFNDLCQLTSFVYIIILLFHNSIFLILCDGIMN